jgi:hypothetical protein
MVYECDQCSAALPPGVTTCPKCGEQFDDAVPSDAEVPRKGFSPAVSTPSPVVAPQPQPTPIPTAPSSAVSKAPSSGFSFVRVLVALPIVLGLMVGYIVLTSPTKNSAGADTPSPISEAIDPPHSVTYKVTGSARSVSVTYQNGTGGTEQKSNVSVPWEATFQATSGAFLYLSAQNQGDSGNLSTEIDVDGSTRKQANASGAYVIADVSDKL